MKIALLAAVVLALLLSVGAWAQAAPADEHQPIATATGTIPMAAETEVAATPTVTPLWGESPITVYLPVVGR